MCLISHFAHFNSSTINLITSKAKRKKRTAKFHATFVLPTCISYYSAISTKMCAAASLAFDVSAVIIAQNLQNSVESAPSRLLQRTVNVWNGRQPVKGCVIFMERDVWPIWTSDTDRLNDISIHLLSDLTLGWKWCVRNLEQNFWQIYAIVCDDTIRYVCLELPTREITNFES